MHFLSSVLFAVSANMDNFTVGLSYGIKKIKIHLMCNLLIAVISSVGTFLSMTMGNIILKILPNNISNEIGCIILIAIGLISLIKSLRNKPISKRNDKETLKLEKILNDPEIADKDKSGVIDIKESITLALALTINNIGLGIGASITGLNIFLTVLLTFIFSFISICISQKIGLLTRISGKKATVLSSVIIIVLGLYELFI